MVLMLPMLAWRIINVGTATQSTILKDDADEVAQICYTLQSSFENSGGDNKESVNDMEDDGLVEDNKDFSKVEQQIYLPNLE